MPDPARAFEVVVIGGGPAGLAAACAAAESGQEVALVEASPWLGGQIWRGKGRPIPFGPAPPSRPAVKEIAKHQSGDLPSIARRWLLRFSRCGATLLESTSVIAAPRQGTLLAQDQNGSRQIFWKRLVLATGARELFLPFPGWTLPGVMGPGALQGLAKQGWPVETQRVVIAGSGPLLLAAADGLARRGARVVTIAEQAPWHRVFRFGLRLCNYPAKLWQAANLKMRVTGVPYKCGTWPLVAEGNDKLRRVILTDGRRTWAEDCDLLACGFGLQPNVELAVLLGCELSDGNVKVDQWQATSVLDVYCAGEPTGIGGADCAVVEGQIAGYAAAGNTSQAKLLLPRRAAWHRFRLALSQTFALRPELKSLATDSTIVCRCEDVTLAHLRQFTNWREAKLLSRCGMGSCQGRVCGAATKVVLGWQPESVRPPILPTKVGSLISCTAMHATPKILWHPLDTRSNSSSSQSNSS